MADIPECPNYREKKCARSDPVYAGETRDQSADVIICRTCNLLWMVTKPRTNRRAAHENKIERMRQATERDRERARRKLIFDIGRRR